MILKLLSTLLLWSAVLFSPPVIFSQNYYLNGSAEQESCNCYQLTPSQKEQGGSVWQTTKIDLNKPFDFAFNVYLGCQDAAGADGIVFMLQPLSTSLGVNGGGLGFQGVSPSIGIALDTWQNVEDNDPAYDHISIQADGVIKHGNDLAGPIPASATSDNIEDCAWHVFRIKWDPVTDSLSTYFDGVFRLAVKKDIITTIFNNDPMVYWGFSASTGGAYNTQKFCTALNPVYSSGLTSDAVCLGNPVTFKDSSTSFATIKNYYWDFGDGSTSTLADPPPHTYAQPGIYQVQHTITALDNCKSTPFTKAIKIGDKPDVSFHVFDTCQTIMPRLWIDANVSVGNIDQWKWEMDGVPLSTTKVPDLTKVAPGNHSVSLMATSDIGCVSNPYTGTFTVLPSPHVAIDADDGCENVPVLFAASLTDNLTTVDKWHWNFGDGTFSDQKDNSHTYTNSANYPIQLSVAATNGCEGTFEKNVFINSVHASAGRDTLVIPDTPFQLNGSGGTIYAWSPETGLDNPGIANPVGNVSDNITYHLTVKTVEGCTDTASVNVSVFKGSAIYVPNAFTPNNDGLNDIIKPYFIGIKTLNYFTIYNRWGQKIFSTNDMSRGWNGYFKNEPKQGSSYVWVLRAVDVVGKVYNLKGTFILIK
ncbi:MAG: PKD domain-containing protein [Ginsengibacter sp.]